MKKEKEYENHIIRQWNFSKELADRVADEEMRKELTMSIFDKTCSPYHYFAQKENGNETVEKPTEKQIKFANDLGIIHPEQYSKHDLSEKIDEARKTKISHTG